MTGQYMLKLQYVAKGSQGSSREHRPREAEVPRPNRPVRTTGSDHRMVVLVPVSRQNLLPPVSVQLAARSLYSGKRIHMAICRAFTHISE